MILQQLSKLPVLPTVALPAAASKAMAFVELGNQLLGLGYNFVAPGLLPASTLALLGRAQLRAA
jgi:hypothetical protein